VAGTENARLRFKVFTRTPASFELYGNDHYGRKLKLPGAETWHTVMVDAATLINRHNKKTPLGDWRRTDRIKLGGKIKALIFTDFEWVAP
jgi:hypothetical protein